MVSRARAAASLIGLLAGLIGMYHGYNETLQGSTAPSSVFINAIGPPCQGNSCLPAMTLIPDFYVTGIVAILVGLAVVAWSSTLINRRWGGAVLIVLSLVLLLVGGGFLPPALGIIAGVIAARTGRQTGSMSAP